MKRIITFILSIVICLGFFGCSIVNKQPEATPVIAGTTSGLCRDGKPHKYFTMSFDDGTQQDLRIIELLKKYNIKCTFFVNTGLCGVSWDWVANQVHKPGLSHLRFTEEELKSGIYNGFDVEGHSLSHGALNGWVGTPEKITDEVQTDMDNIYGFTGIKPCGFSYPGGQSDSNTEAVRQILLDTTDVRFARTIQSTAKFDLPENFMEWNPTTGLVDHNIISYAKKFIKAECDHDMLFYLWGHGYELDGYDYWDKFEEFLKLLSEADDIVFVTNAELYQLFKDEIPSHA